MARTAQSLVILGALLGTGVDIAAQPIPTTFATSRLFGVAPLAVFFDATEIPAPGMARPFHDIEYRWEFGDPAQGASWHYGSRAAASSRNAATGAVAAHVFETPGNFTVALSMNGATIKRTISVLDPESVFTGGNTTCFSGSGDYAGCPPGARHVLTSDFPSAIETYSAPGKRLLFRRGEVFQSHRSARITAGGPGLVGAYPATGAKPVVRVNGAGHAVLLLSDASSPDMGDWRLMDLEIDGQSNAEVFGVRAAGSARQVTILRLDMHNLGHPLQFAANALHHNNSSGRFVHAIFDQLAIVDSRIAKVVGGGGHAGGFISAKRFSFLGNAILDTSAGGHNLRTPYIGKGVVSNNTLSEPAAGRHLIQMHAPCRRGSGCNVLSSVFDGSEFTEYVVVSDNKFIGGGPGAGWSVYVGPQNDTSDERLRNIVYERNWHVAGSGTRTGLSFDASEITIRNNIFDMTGGVGGYSCMLFRKRGSTAVADAIRIYNNTCYSNDRRANLVFLRHEVGAGHDGGTVMATNNLAYAPKAVSAALLAGPGIAKVTASHNSTDSHIRATAPGWVEAEPTQPSGFMLGARSPYVDAGLAVPVHSDFLLKPRPRGTGVDIGALER